MLPIRSILHPTDFSDLSRNAFKLACALARDYRARLLVLHVVPTPLAVYMEGVAAEPLTDYRDEVHAQLCTMRPDDPAIRPEYFTLEGDPTQEILQFAGQHCCDLIVLGTHGRTGLGRLLMGSIAEAVVRKAGCPVLTVKTPLRALIAVPAAEEAHVTLETPPA
jgi:nucleotide-binding universal stress UspA family protein